MCYWIKLYSDVLTELLPEDRPKPEEVDDDALFDLWMVRYERQQQQKTAERKHNQQKSERGQAHGRVS